MKELAWITLFRARNRLQYIDVVACRLLWEAEDSVLNERPLNLSNVEGLLCN